MSCFMYSDLIFVILMPLFISRKNENFNCSTDHCSSHRLIIFSMLSSIGEFVLPFSPKIDILLLHFRLVSIKVEY